MKMTIALPLALIVLIKIVLAQNIEECQFQFKNDGVFFHSQKLSRPLVIKMIQMNPETPCRMTVIPQQLGPIVFCINSYENRFMPNGDIQNKTELKRKGKDQLWLYIKSKEGMESRSGRYDISGEIAYAFQTPPRENDKEEFNGKIEESHCNTVQAGMKEVRGRIKLTNQFKLCHKFNKEMKNEGHITSEVKADETFEITTKGENYVSFLLKTNLHEKETKITIKCRINKGDGVKDYSIKVKLRMEELNCVSKPYTPTESVSNPYTLIESTQNPAPVDIPETSQLCSNIKETNKAPNKTLQQTRSTQSVDKNYISSTTTNPVTLDYVNEGPKQIQEECNVTFKFKKPVTTYSTLRRKNIRLKMTQTNPEQKCLLIAILPNSDQVSFNVSNKFHTTQENENYTISLYRNSKDNLWMDVTKKKKIEIRNGQFNISGKIVYGFPSPPPQKISKIHQLTLVSNIQCLPESISGTVKIGGPFNLCIKFHNYWKHDINNYLRYNRKEILNISFENEEMHFQYKFNDTSKKDCRFEIKCRVIGGDGEKEYPISIKTECQPDIRIASTTIWLPIVLVVVFGIIVMYAGQQRKKHRIIKLELRRNEEKTQNLPEWTKEFYMPRGYIKMEEKLGEGAFGEVFKARVQNISLSTFDGNHYVAVKTAIPGGYHELLKEGEVLSKMDYHYNVINFLAISTGTTEENDTLMLIFEYCQKGCLHDFLEEKKETKNIEVSQMVAWTYQMAMGMEFLCDNRIIHGDLATRNILLDTDLNIKIGDFGKAHRINYANIEVPVKGAQPMLWMAPEALQDHAVSLNSDKWSYGVTVWEIFSFGIDPYPERPDYRGLLEDLNNGHRMAIPEKCPSRIFSEVIYPSWKQNPEERPTWSALIKLLESLVDSEYLKRYQMLRKTRKKYYKDLSTSMAQTTKHDASSPTTTD